MVKKNNKKTHRHFAIVKASVGLAGLLLTTGMLFGGYSPVQAVGGGLPGISDDFLPIEDGMDEIPQEPTTTTTTTAATTTTSETTTFPNLPSVSGGLSTGSVGVPTSTTSSTIETTTTTKENTSPGLPTISGELPTVTGSVPPSPETTSTTEETPLPEVPQLEVPTSEIPYIDLPIVTTSTTEESSQETTAMLPPTTTSQEEIIVVQTPTTTSQEEIIVVQTPTTTSTDASIPPTSEKTLPDTGETDGGLIAVAGTLATITGLGLVVGTKSQRKSHSSFKR